MYPFQDEPIGQAFNSFGYHVLETTARKLFDNPEINRTQRTFDAFKKDHNPQSRTNNAYKMYDIATYLGYV